MHVAPRRGDDLIVEHRLQLGRAARPLLPQALARAGAAQAGDGAHRPRLHLVHRGILRPGVQPDLADLLLPAVLSLAAGQGLAHPELASGELQPAQTLPPLVPADLEHPGGEALSPLGLQGVPLQSGQQLLHPLQLQRRAEEAGEHPAGGDEGGQVAVVRRLPRQITLHQLLIAQRGAFQQLLPACAKVHAPPVQPLPQLVHQGRPVGPRLVHLVDEEKGGDALVLQQPPQCGGVSLDAVRPADHQNGVVQHLEGALHLGGKVHMPRGVQQRQLQLPQGQPGLLGEDGDAPLPLLRIGIRHRVLVVHPSHPPGLAGNVEQGLGQCGLARVHMGQQASTNTFDRLFSRLPAHKRSSPVKTYW